MYSLNFGFWSSKSFAFSPDDFTSGFTGSGGFSLLWGPFVQPCKKPVPYSQTVVVQANTTEERVAINFFWFLINQHIPGDTTVEINKSVKREKNRKLTAMLRKSEKSVVLLLQQDHPWEDFTQTLVLTTKGDKVICVFSNYLPSRHHGTLGLLGDMCSHL